MSSIEERKKERFQNKSRQLSSKYLNKLVELPGAPSQYEYFHNILRRTFIEDRIREDMEEKIVGTYCVMVPQELIYASGARPVKLCSGNYIGFHFGDEVAPRDACPLVKAIIGNHVTKGCGIVSECDMYVVPITCDCKKKMASILREYKETIELQIPINKTDDLAMETYIKELWYLKEQLESMTGKKITRKSLLNEIQTMAQVQQQIYRFIQLKGQQPPLIRGSHGLAIMNSFSYEQAKEWGEHLRLLNDELELRLRNQQILTKKKLPRILLTGSPMTFPNLKVPLLLEEMDGLMVADETCMGDRGLYDPVVVSDSSMMGLMRALANRYVLPCSCPVFTENEQRIRRIEQMIEKQKVDGVIYHVLRGCLVYDYEYSLLEKRMEERNIPIIRVESDYNEEDVEQLRIRLEAFVEMIKFSK